MKIAICDDEVIYAKDIEKHINQYAIEHGLSLDIYTFYNSKDLLSANEIFDIAFLDIEIDDRNGIYIGKKLQEKNSSIVLMFVTKYEHYLDDALDLGSTRFFDKPIDSQRFYRGLEKAINKVDNSEVLFHICDEDNGIVTLNTNDIIYIEIKGRKTKLVSKSKDYYSKESIKAWKDKLNKSYFVSPHNSYIINTNYITYFKKDHVILSGKYYVPIAYTKRAEFKKQYMISIGG